MLEFLVYANVFLLWTYGVWETATIFAKQKAINRQLDRRETHIEDYANSLKGEDK